MTKQDATHRLHQDMREVWNEVTIPKALERQNIEEKKRVIQEVMHDDINSEEIA